MLSNLGTIGYHCKELPVLKVGTDGSQRGNQRLPWQGTAGSQTLKLTAPNLRLEATIARNGRFPEVRTYVLEAKRLS